MTIFALHKILCLLVVSLLRFIKLSFIYCIQCYDWTTTSSYHHQSTIGHSCDERIVWLIPSSSSSWWVMRPAINVQTFIYPPLVFSSSSDRSNHPCADFHLTNFKFIVLLWCFGMRVRRHTRSWGFSSPLIRDTRENYFVFHHFPGRLWGRDI